MNVREFVKLVTPPLAIKLAKRFLSRLLWPKEWEYVPEGWAYTRSHTGVKGWAATDVLKLYRQKWPTFVQMVEGANLLGFSHESDLTSCTDVIQHNTIMVFAYSIALAAHGLSSMSVLDWGGGIGHYYVLARSLIQNVEIDYHCRDLSLFADYGRELFPTQHFYVDESCFDRTYDFVLTSSSLQYAEHWEDVLGDLSRVTNGYILVTRLPIINDGKSFVYVQRPYAHGYNTEYLGWCIARQSLLNQAFESKLTLVREFIIGESAHISNAPGQCEFRGYLFRSMKRGDLR